MPALPADIARYTNDGIALTFRDDALKLAQPNATDAGEIPTFFRYEADGLFMMNERAVLQSEIGAFHEAIEVDEVLGIGTSLGVVPVVPTFRAIDDSRDLDGNGRTASISFDMVVDRYSVELMG